MRRSDNDWKQKYLSVLDRQEKSAAQQQQLMALLVKAVVRMSLIAEGVDQQLDKQLLGLRQLLREGTPSGQDLNTLVVALEGQAKRLEAVKSERSRVISAAFQSLVSQLRQLKPNKDAKQQLQSLHKNIKTRSGEMQEYSALITEYARVQQSVMAERDVERISKPFWHRWVESSEQGPAQGRPGQATAQQNASSETNPTEKNTIGKTPEQAGVGADSAPPAETEPGNQRFDLSHERFESVAAIAPDSTAQEPPFSRLNQAICDVLSELLVQIEPPPLARENYHSAKQQIAKGLNWYELVPTLEDISLVVISAFDNHQRDFESFLSRLNERLTEAYQFISTSGFIHGEGIESSRALNQSVREQVSAIQQSVADATEIEQLKCEVSSRLDQIVSAMDQHQSSEQQRESSLSEQLDALVDQVKSMETASEDAEQRIEEQRQKALRDVLTQLPNREAYQQRLEQEFERWLRYGRSLSMVVCDIDFFKKINDNYGHLAGDKVLRIIARILGQRLRKTDFIARYGGEEFVILMPETEQQQVLNVVEGIRQAIANCPFHFKEQRVSITMSFGVSEFVVGDQSGQVFARADKALYQAKEQGRNQCVLAKLPDAGSQTTADAP